MRMFGYRPPQKTIPNWKIVLGDQVVVNAGAYKDAKGKVIKVLRKRNMVTVSGVNLKFKMVADDENTRVKKAIQKEAPVHISNVSLIDP
jgi:large subunit ribosomal protein L24